MEESLALIHCHEAKFPNIEAVLFDKDGTLSNSTPFLKIIGQKRAHLIEICVPGIQDVLLRTFGLIDNTLDPAGLLAVGSRYENEIAAAAQIVGEGHGWDAALSIAKSSFHQADLLVTSKSPQTPLFPGVQNFLDRLLTCGLKLGLLSADSSINVSDFVQTYHLATYFQFVMGIDQPPGKPDPVLVHMACDALNVSPKRLLVIGDAPVDIQLAHAGYTAGCIAMAWDGVDSSHLWQAEAIAHTFCDIQIKKDN